ncbi:MAG: hypothetical protein V3T83_08595 [Acidobacteriota bacterium]
MRCRHGHNLLPPILWHFAQGFKCPIWRLRWKGEWLYVILEFPSTVEHFMAVRMAADARQLLYQELIRQGMLTR